MQGEGVENARPGTKSVVQIYRGLGFPHGLTRPQYDFSILSTIGAHCLSRFAYDLHLLDDNREFNACVTGRTEERWPRARSVMLSS